MKNILILGGTGKTGRRVARRLRAAGHPVRTASRTGGTERAVSRTGGTERAVSRIGGDVSYDHVLLDLGDPGTWAPALEGVAAVYVVEPDLRASADNPERVPRFVAEAAAAGARRFVLLSAPRAGEDGHPLKPAEQAVRSCGAGWTILRPNWFSQNFSEAFWLQGILAGTLSLPTGDGRTPFVDAEDIAEVAASALTEERHSGETYGLTGPRAIGFGEAARLIGEAVGREIRHDDVDPEVHVERQVAVGVPPAVARLLTGLLVDIRDGRGADVHDGVERALGRPPRPFEDYVAETAAAGVWDGRLGPAPGLTGGHATSR